MKCMKINLVIVSVLTSDLYDLYWIRRVEGKIHLRLKLNLWLYKLINQPREHFEIVLKDDKSNRVESFLDKI